MSNDNAQNLEIVNAPIVLGEVGNILDMDTRFSIQLDKNDGQTNGIESPRAVGLDQQQKFRELYVSVAGVTVDGIEVAMTGQFSQDKNEGQFRVTNAINSPEDYALVKGSILDHQSRFEAIAAVQADALGTE